jgi:hypothetical protein
MNILTVQELRDYIATADDDDIQDFLDHGLTDLIEELEQDDFFGTEGFGKRYA